ncbi:K(+)/H(+) antiporter [Coemansia sp. RSA 1822]|nr:K(+)/H(+) antiporter [Coemansia sp. RSA 638]KAJ2563412.1 K(+)/H(+) antiporter [Coemansia sp. RSA 1822]
MAGSDSPSIISGRNPIKFSTSDPLTLFIVQLLIIVCLCRLLHFFLKRLYQPSVISEIIGGILLGPTALGRWKAFSTNVFPKESLVNLNLVANFGLVLFLFMIGLELDPRMLKKNISRGVAISIAGIALPFGLGAAVSYALYSILMDSAGKFVNFLLFCGVAMAITAFPVLARILTERNLLKTTVGSISMSAAAVDDVVSWCLLALVIALTNNSSGLTALYVFLAGLAWVLFVMFAVRPVFLGYLRRSGVLSGRDPTQTVLFITFMMVLISAFYTDAIGIHAIFGGFLIGVIIPHDGGFAVKVVEKIEDVVHIFFLPIYFTLSGLKTDFTDLKEGETWGLWVLVTFVAFFGKIVGCGLAARFTKFTWRESLTVGILMATKGLVELVVLNIGLDAGVIDTRIFSLMVLMAIVTTVATTPLVTWIYPPKYHKRLDDLHTDGTASESGDVDPNAGPPANLLIVLSRIQQVPAAMTLLGYLCRRLTGNQSTHTSDAPLSTVHKHVYRPLRVFGLRLLELTGRDSSIMQHFESETQVLTDPAMSMFRAFARVANMAFHAALAYSDREHFVDNICNSSQDASAEITVVSAFGRSSSSNSDIVASQAGKSPDLAPGWFESFGWGFTSEQQASFITALFAKAQNHLCVFIDCGLADGEAKSKLDAFVAPSTDSSAELEINEDSEDKNRVVVATSTDTDTDRATDADGRRVPLVVVPFFGGADDRQAVRLVSELCTHAAVQVVVWRFVRASTPTGDDVVLNEDRFPSKPNIPQTPAASHTHNSNSAEINPWDQTLDDAARQSDLAAATRVDDEVSKSEAAEREEDEVFIATCLRPGASGADKRANRMSTASVHTATELPDQDQPAIVATDEDPTARGGIRQKLAQRLRLRHTESRHADSAPEPSRWSAAQLQALDGVVSTLTAGDRSTQFANMRVKTIATSTPLQTFLLRARTLLSTDLIICGRSVTNSQMYFNHAQELAAYTPAGHLHTKIERQRALGTAAEYLLGFGTSASILVIQAGPNAQVSV